MRLIGIPGEKPPVFFRQRIVGEDVKGMAVAQGQNEAAHRVHADSFHHQRSLLVPGEELFNAFITAVGTG